MQIFKKIIYLLSLSEKKYALFLFFMILIMALLDVIGIASVFPFITVLGNPEIIENNVILSEVYNISKSFGVKEKEQFIFFLGFCVFFFIFLSLFFKSVTTFLQLRYIHMLESSIGKRLFSSYLNQPYVWFLYRNSSDISKTLLSEVQTVINNGLQPMMELITQFCVVIVILILLFLVDPKLAFISCISLSFAYGLIYFFTRGLLKHIGQERIKSNQERFNIVDEAFGAFKEVKVFNLIKMYSARFSKSSKIHASNTALSQILGQLPRFAIEGVAFGGMILVILYFMSQKGNFLSILPILALYAFAGYRLMPSLQRMFLSLSLLRFVEPALDSLNNDLKNLMSVKINKGNKFLKIDDSISLKNINFKYPSASDYVLKDINMDIELKSSIAIVGATGSGKSTIIDIILGLLDADKGILEIDNNILNKDNLASWQENIGFVPQNIFLADDTISANIAFGVDKDKVNNQNMEIAAKIANIHEFITQELPLKYETTIGERGVRLSGGQRQRIGIARALYKNPKILILDESTSALDSLTEKSVVEALNTLNKDLTTIFITHRLSTIIKCNKIFIIDKGKIIGQGTYKNLLNSNKSFQKLVKANYLK
jgi:ABC-type multidrug transport system fused ATPase/permease subunit